MKKLVLVGPAEIRLWLRVSRQRAYQLINRADFPEPYQVLQMGKVWDIADVDRWIRSNRPWLYQTGEPGPNGRGAP
ncbi:putative regulatory protein [Actinoplanes missouriensis 431]|uniref:Putative regulatory protein n=1 Tax=Actinoplanes missouriensis (strain ATCC 14538 / DSM 43046 / CBS 188.64 / JCM 3121 / NBRC 102363 / NCIMB 12654 / NRRL B-3342 / UNCC 431) TaxID=512565 RepID=I0H733_ACTM4|nr:DNA-binding protein [Actinoplanes missouriensis]BAL88820.1 putative regulatory protein [Actinoplanes missouriensis 431]